MNLINHFLVTLSMLPSNISLVSSFVLGAVHSLEPGHGKSILALHTSQSRKWSDGISLLASLLLTHFSLTMVVSLILYFNPQWANYEWIRFAAPFLIIFYGLFLLIKSKRNSDEYVACNCSHEESSTVKNPILMGFIVGLTPCPSVFAPIVIGLSSRSFDQIFLYLFSYIIGVVAVFLAIFVGVLFLKSKTSSVLNSIITRINPHLISGFIMIGIGIFYLLMNFHHHH